MSVYAAALCEIINTKYSGRWYEKITSSLKENFIEEHKNDTVLVVVREYPDADEDEEECTKQVLALLKPFIIYKSKKAVNFTTGHGTKPRNTLYILEFSESTPR